MLSKLKRTNSTFIHYSTNNTIDESKIGLENDNLNVGSMKGDFLI